MKRLILGLCVACLAGCHSPTPRHNAQAVITRVQFFPEVLGDPARKAHVLYQDGALATPVPGGTLWTFGDTFMGVRGEDGKPQYAGALSNTMAFLLDGAKDWPPHLEYLSGPDGVAIPPLSLVPGEDEKTRRLWPLAGVWLDHRAYMFYGLIEVTGPGPWGFKGIGTGLAHADQPFGIYERLHDGAGAWPMDPAAIVRQDGWLYMYAPRRFRGDKDMSSGMLIGRVREAEIESPEKYMFFAGLEGGGVKWVSRVTDAKSAAEDVWGQASVAWNSHLNLYLLATSSNFFRNDQIQLRQGPTPWGPWTAVAGVKDGLIKVPEREGEKTQLIYCTMLHPELDEAGGRIVTLTFCRMLTREWAFTNPEGVRLELGQ